MIFLISSYFSFRINAIIPKRAIKKTTIPKEGLNKLILIPVAKTPEEISFAEEIASMPPIIPIKCPKNPQTNANKL